MINFNEIQSRMFVGTYPQTPLDIDRLRMGPGVTAVLNLQTDQDFRVLGVNWETLQRHYHEQDLVVQRFPIRDFDPDDLRVRLTGAVDLLSDMMGIGHTVYVHCTAGVGRAPAVAIGYLAWRGDRDVEEAYRHVRARRPCDPYIEIIRELADSR